MGCSASSKDSCWARTNCRQPNVRSPVAAALTRRASAASHARAKPSPAAATPRPSGSAKSAPPAPSYARRLRPGHLSSPQRVPIGWPAEIEAGGPKMGSLRNTSTHTKSDSPLESVMVRRGGLGLVVSGLRAQQAHAPRTPSPPPRLQASHTPSPPCYIAPHPLFPGTFVIEVPMAVRLDWHVALLLVRVAALAGPTDRSASMAPRLS